MDEIRINVPEGMEIDRENSTFECIKFKKKIDFTPKKGDFIYITTTQNYWYLCIFDHMDGTVIDGYLIQDDGGRVSVQTKTLPIVRMESVSDIKPASYGQLQNMLDRIDKKGYEWSDGRIRMKPPKTWEEFCEVYPPRQKEYYIDNTSNICEACNFALDRRNSIVDKNLLPNKETAEAILALLQLIQLRDCYNDGWKPDWQDIWVTKYCIVSDEQTLKRNTCTISHVLAFKTAELREQFLENFRDLIEIAKPLI